MLEKMAMGMLGGALQSLLGLGGSSSTKGTTETADAGLFTTLLKGAGSDVSEDGVNASDKVSAGGAEALASLKEMTSGGIEGYWKYMIKQLREKTMEEMGVTEESLAAMPPEQKSAIEDKIAEKVKEAMAKMMGVSPDEAAKMMALVKEVPVTQDVQNQANKAYKEDVPTV